MEHIAWMAWTLPTAIFFVMLSLTLAVMTWLAVAYPEAERVGVLRIPTTRGARLLISPVTAAVIPPLWTASPRGGSARTEVNFRAFGANQEFRWPRPYSFSARSSLRRNGQIRDQPGP